MLHWLSQLINSFNFFIGKTLTVLDAGFALNTQGSFVNGFTPFRAGLAGFDFNFKFNAPPILKDPFFFNSLAASVSKPSTAPFTSLAFKPAVSATEAYAPLTLSAPDFIAPAFIAFIAFIAFMIVISVLRNGQIQLEQ